MGDTPTAPELPGSPPKELVDFIECRAATATLSDGKVTWIGGMGLHPTLTIEPGKTPGTATILVDVPILGKASVPVAIRDGNLEVAEANPTQAGAQLQQFASDLNAWLKANGKALGSPVFKPGRTVLSKVAWAPPVQAQPAPGPATPAAQPKPEPKPEPKPGPKAELTPDPGQGPSPASVGHGAANEDFPTKVPMPDLPKGHQFEPTEPPRTDTGAPGAPSRFPRGAAGGIVTAIAAAFVLAFVFLTMPGGGPGPVLDPTGSPAPSAGGASPAASVVGASPSVPGGGASPSSVGPGASIPRFCSMPTGGETLAALIRSGQWDAFCGSWVPDTGVYLNNTQGGAASLADGTAIDLVATGTAVASISGEMAAVIREACRKGEVRCGSEPVEAGDVRLFYLEFLIPPSQQPNRFFELGVNIYSERASAGATAARWTGGVSDVLTGSNLAYSLRYPAPGNAVSGPIRLFWPGTPGTFFMETPTSSFLLEMPPAFLYAIPLSEIDGPVDARLFGLSATPDFSQIAVDLYPDHTDPRLPLR